jgi:L-fuconolactonase
LRIDAGVERLDGDRAAVLRRILERNRFDDAIVRIDGDRLATLDGVVRGVPDIEEAAARGLACDVVINDAARVAELARAFPAARLVTTMPGAPRDLGALASVTNVAVKVCCVSGRVEDYRDHVRAVLATLGHERLMFGSGWPVGIESTTWKQRLAAFTQAIGAQSMEAREWILGGTAARWYGLRVAVGPTAG